MAKCDPVYVQDLSSTNSGTLAAQTHKKGLNINNHTE